MEVESVLPRFRCAGTKLDSSHTHLAGAPTVMKTEMDAICMYTRYCPADAGAEVSEKKWLQEINGL
jgi:hypothetical protein